MMSDRQRLTELYRRRVDLVVRSADQRVELGNACHAWRLPLAMADRGVAAWRFMHKHPVLLVGVSATLVLTRPRLALKWFRRGWTLWQAYRGLTKGRGS
ncbi:MAG: YqjK-like family protein [Betaproteobacteria bacterium]|nr:YqjK-like family protein [Betaproteobacteria bacterium]